MEKNLVLMESLFKMIEKENPHLKKMGGAHDFDLFLNNHSQDAISKEEMISFLKSVRFTIHPFIADSSADNDIFKKVKSDFVEHYVDINFEYNLQDGVSYRLEPFIVDTLDLNNAEYVFAAVEKLLPDQAKEIREHWDSWTIEQKTDLLYELERASMNNAQKWLKENGTACFSHFEIKTKENILRKI